MPPRDVAILIPTLRRPQSLERALVSVFAQIGVQDRIAEIVVVDNDPDASAQGACNRLAASCPWRLAYVHEPHPGVATARNAGLGATAAPLIAFLDDDEEAPPTWLASLLDAQQRFDADVVFGPVAGRAPDAPPRLRAWLDRFFSRIGPAASGLVDRHWGCGNSLMRRAAVLPGHAPFDAAQDEIGGEDDVLFTAARARGARFAWCAEAEVLEYAPAHRASLRYALLRGFAYGQSPCQAAARAHRWWLIPAWMAVGAGQAVVYGLAGAVLALAGSSNALDLLDRSARGLGKVFWTRRFEPRVYGSAALRNGPTVHPAPA